MNWKKRMVKGMETIKKACHDADFCCDCPFIKYCNILTESEETPNEWIFKDDEDN